MEALGQQPVPDENAEAVMGAHSNGEIITHRFFVAWDPGKKKGAFLTNLFQVLEVWRGDTPAQKEAASGGNQWSKSLSTGETSC